MENITGYIESKNFSSPKTAQPYTSVLNAYTALKQMFPEESIDQIVTRHLIGKSASSAKFAKSVIYGYESFNGNSQIPQNFSSGKTSEQLAEELRQQEAKQSFLNEEKLKADQEARAKYEELEAQRLAEAEAQKEAEAQAKREAQEARIKARTEGFISEEIPAYISKFDYMQNIPKTAREYYAQGTEEAILNKCHALGKHVILEGRAGSGKTELVIKLAKEQEEPIFKFSCSSDVRMADLIGSKTISEDGNSIQFEAGMLTKAVLTANKYGKAILLLDEINVLSEKVQKNINGLADGTGFIDLPMGRIAINKGARLLIAGTMNLGYTGTNILNPELKDRFLVISMPDMTRETKLKIYSKFNISETIENGLIDLSNQLNNLQAENKIAGDVVFSTRSQIAFLELLEELELDQVPNAIQEALNVTLVSKFDDGDDKTKVKNLIDRIF